MASLVGLLTLGDGPQSFASWLKTHAGDHNDVALATGTPFVILDPFDFENDVARRTWLLDHQRSHDAVNEHFGTLGADLSDLNFDDREEVQAWVDLNYQEHLSWQESLPAS